MRAFCWPKYRIQRNGGFFRMSPALIAICHRCPHRQQTCAGACPCTIDGRDILDHATTGDCPKGYFENVAEMPPVLEPDLSCTHRGDVVDKVQCQTCGGNVQIKVFACTVHVQCTIAKLDAYRDCGTCGDRFSTASAPRPESPDPSSP